MVAFLDESILNSRNPLFADWPRKPLQEELFGTHMAGEVFFQNLQKLLGRTDSHELADLLEVYYLCLLLGFGGRYSMGNKGDLRAIMDAVARKNPPHPRVFAGTVAGVGAAPGSRAQDRLGIPGCANWCSSRIGLCCAGAGAVCDFQILVELGSVGAARAWRVTGR